MNTLIQKIVLLLLFLAFSGYAVSQTSQRAQRNEQPEENAAQQNQAAEPKAEPKQTTAQKQAQTQAAAEEQQLRDRYVYSPGIMLPKIDSSNLNAPPTPQPNPQRRENAKNWLIEQYDYSGKREKVSQRAELASYLNQSCDAVIDRLRTTQTDNQEFKHLSTSLDTVRLLKKDIEQSITDLSRFEAIEFQQLKKQEEDTLKILDDLGIKIEQAIYLFF